MRYAKTNSDAYEIYLGGKEGIKENITPGKLICRYGNLYASSDWVLETLKNRAIVAEIEYWIVQGEFEE